MKHTICWGLLALLLGPSLFFNARAKEPQKLAMYSVAFYNLENLFDTIHDAGKNDFEYLPDGQNKWNSMKYNNKLKNMSKVLSQLATDKLPMGPAAIGVSEVENRRVLDDLLKQPALANRGYEVLHYEGPDKRGVDCALFYNPRFFQLKNSQLVQYVYENGDTVRKTRGFLVARGEMAGEDMAIIVNHWPSRGATSPFREMAGRQVRHIKDSLMTENPAIKVIIMGDLNDDPDDKSLRTALGAMKDAKKCGPTDLFNPWWRILRVNGVGTLMYDGKWNLFDQIIVNGNLLGDDRSTLKYYKPEVFTRDFMIQKEGRYKGAPLRTFSSGVWLNGFSDHLPTILYMVKEVK